MYTRIAAMTTTAILKTTTRSRQSLRMVGGLPMWHQLGKEKTDHYRRRADHVQ